MRTGMCGFWFLSAAVAAILLRCASLDVDPVVPGGKGEEHLRIPHDLSTTTALAMSGDGSLLAAGKSRGALAVWSLKNGELMFSGDIGNAGIVSILISSDNSYLVIGMDNGFVILWDIPSKKTRRVIIKEDKGTSCCCVDMFRYARSFKPKISTLSLVNRDKYFFIGRKNGVFQMFPLDGNATTNELQFKNLNCLQSSSGDGKGEVVVLAGCRFLSRTVTVYRDHYSGKEKIVADTDLATDIADRALKIESSYRKQEFYTGTMILMKDPGGSGSLTYGEKVDLKNPSTVSAVAVLPGGKGIISLTRYDQKGLSTLRLHGMDLTVQSSIEYPGDHDSNWLRIPSAVSYSHSGDIIACAGSRGVVHIVSVKGKSLIKIRDILVKKESSVSSVALSKDGKILFTGNNSSPAVEMYQVSTGKKIAALVYGNASDWIIHSTDGFLDGKGVLFKKSVMVVHGKEIPLPLRDGRYYRRGLLGELVNTVH